MFSVLVGIPLIEKEMLQNFSNIFTSCFTVIS